MLKDKVLSLPLLPGVYIMKDIRGKVIYVGKAKALKNRVSSYFNTNKSLKTTMLVSNLHDFDIIVTNSEFEALILENSLIKKHKPKYNILLKDDKGYPYIKINVLADFPEITLANKKVDDDNKYFGPYTSRAMAYSAIKTVQKMFRLKQCKRKFPRDIGKERPCIYAQIGQCSSPCDASVLTQEYKQQIDDAIKMLSGKFSTKDMNVEMMKYSQDMEFEKAAQLRDRINIINNLGGKYNVLAVGFVDLDAIAFQSIDNRACITVLHYTRGVLSEKEHIIIDGLTEQDHTEALDSFVKQYYSIRQNVPKTVLISQEIEGMSVLSEWLFNINNKKVDLIFPQKGDKKHFIELACKNGHEELLRIKTTRPIKSLEILKEKLGLENIPNRIEAYDISHISGTAMVASMIVFKDARPLKKAYRKFKIKQENIDDIASMKEVLTRRLQRYKNDDESFNILPDIFMIDGGIAQVRAARMILDSFDIDTIAVGMVKDNKHKTRALILPDTRELSLENTSVLFTLIGKIQEEVHRFAIDYHKKLRMKNMYYSELDDIVGIGKARKKALIDEFKTVDNIKNAEIWHIEKIVGRNIAKIINQHFNGEKNENY